MRVLFKASKKGSSLHHLFKTLNISVLGYEGLLQKPSYSLHWILKEVRTAFSIVFKGGTDGF